MTYQNKEKYHIFFYTEVNPHFWLTTESSKYPFYFMDIFQDWLYRLINIMLRYQQWETYIKWEKITLYLIISFAWINFPLSNTSLNFIHSWYDLLVTKLNTLFCSSWMQCGDKFHEVSLITFTSAPIWWFFLAWLLYFIFWHIFVTIFCITSLKINPT